MHRYIAVLLIVCLLSACGGDGGSSMGAGSVATPSKPTAQDLADAKAADLNLILFNPVARIAKVQWTDTFPTAAGYLVQSDRGDGSWNTIDTVAGQGGTGKLLSGGGVIGANESLRVEAVLTGFVVLIETASGKQSVVTSVPPGSIALNQAQPVSGPVTISISGGGVYKSVNYYIDLDTLIATGTNPPDYAVSLDTSILPQGAHFITADVQGSSGSLGDLGLSMQITQPQFPVTVVANTHAEVPGVTEIEVTASAASGIQSVSAYVDGHFVGTLTAPTLDNTYLFAVPANLVKTGTYAVTAQVTNGAGNTTSGTTSGEISNPPLLALASPVNGVLANGTLHIAATYSSDKVGAPRLTIMLGPKVVVLNATGSSFATNFSLADLPVGSYPLTAVVTDVTGDSVQVTALVSVTSTPALAYKPVFSLPAAGSLWDAEGTSYVYTVGGSSYVSSLSFGFPWSPVVSSAFLRSGTTTTALNFFTQPSIPLDQVGYNPGQLSNEHIFASGDDGDGYLNVYMWAPDGSRTDLSALASPGGSAEDDVLVAAHWPWVVWSVMGGGCNSFPVGAVPGFVAYNVMTGESDVIFVPVGYQSAIASDFYLSAQSGAPVLYFGAGNSDEGCGIGANIFVWNQVTKLVKPVTTDGSSELPQADGTFVAWTYTAATFPILRVLNIASNAVTTLTFNVDEYSVGGGLVEWTEPSKAGTDLLAYYGTTVAPPLAAACFPSASVSGGYVVAGGSAWSPQHGVQVFFEGCPAKVFVKGSTVFFVNGGTSTPATGGAVYAVALH